MKLPICVWSGSFVMLVSSVCIAQSSRPQITNSLGMSLVLIPAGEFVMGSTSEQSEAMLRRMKEQGVHEWYQHSPPSEVPPHRVRITTPFYMGAYEVRVADFTKFFEVTAYRTDAERDGN